eukprot:scaffold7654_cov109-Isochrysis_galbana.AAC.3
MLERRQHRRFIQRRQRAEVVRLAELGLPGAGGQDLQWRDRLLLARRKCDRHRRLGHFGHRAPVERLLGVAARRGGDVHALARCDSCGLWKTSGSWRGLGVSETIDLRSLDASRKPDRWGPGVRRDVLGESRGDPFADAEGDTSAGLGAEGARLLEEELSVCGGGGLGGASGGAAGGDGAGFGRGAGAGLVAASDARLAALPFVPPNRPIGRSRSPAVHGRRLARCGCNTYNLFPSSVREA